MTSLISIIIIASICNFPILSNAECLPLPHLLSISNKPHSSGWTWRDCVALKEKKECESHYFYCKWVDQKCRGISTFLSDIPYGITFDKVHDRICQKIQNEAVLLKKDETKALVKGQRVKESKYPSIDFIMGFRITCKKLFDRYFLTEDGQGLNKLYDAYFGKLTKKQISMGEIGNIKKKRSSLQFN